ncbi:MAG TPA: cupredoxin family copper-binding protein [Pseudonocardiaceae bacterium]|nr:cupredoxin family copper-binding protein [Pseudonocardiaceae bacterium]
MRIREIFDFRGSMRADIRDGKAATTLAVTAVRSRLAAILLAMLVVVVGLMVGSSGAMASVGAGGGDPAAVSAAPATIVISNFAYGPASLSVAPGTKITVVNQDRPPHTVTARDKSFDTGTIAGGQRGEFTAPSSPGTYPYICTVHPSMTGVLIVA